MRCTLGISLRSFSVWCLALPIFTRASFSSPDFEHLACLNYGPGTVIVWGDAQFGGNAPAIPGLRNVRQVIPTHFSFSALRNDGYVITWGDSRNGGQTDSDTQDKLMGVVAVASTNTAFAALRRDSSVVTWGNEDEGGHVGALEEELSGDVKAIYGNDHAFAALKLDGSVVTWGAPAYGGHADDVKSLLQGVVTIYTTWGAFAALLADGQVITWGDQRSGGVSTFPTETYSTIRGGSRVTKVFSTWKAFAALTEHGKVVAWGDSCCGGDTYSVHSELRNVTKVLSTWSAFAALRSDGSVVTWGLAERGGDSSFLQHRLSHGVKNISTTSGAFYAYYSDGTFVRWGDTSTDTDHITTSTGTTLTLSSTGKASVALITSRPDCPAWMYTTTTSTTTTTNTTTTTSTSTSTTSTSTTTTTSNSTTSTTTTSTSTSTTSTTITSTITTTTSASTTTTSSFATPSGATSSTSPTRTATTRSTTPTSTTSDSTSTLRASSTSSTAFSTMRELTTSESTFVTTTRASTSTLIPTTHDSLTASTSTTIGSSTTSLSTPPLVISQLVTTTTAVALVSTSTILDSERTSSLQSTAASQISSVTSSTSEAEATGIKTSTSAAMTTSSTTTLTSSERMEFSTSSNASMIFAVAIEATLSLVISGGSTNLTTSKDFADALSKGLGVPLTGAGVVVIVSVETAPLETLGRRSKGLKYLVQLRFITIDAASAKELTTFMTASDGVFSAEATNSLQSELGTRGLALQMLDVATLDVSQRKVTIDLSACEQGDSSLGFGSCLSQCRWESLFTACIPELALEPELTTTSTFTTLSTTRLAVTIQPPVVRDTEWAISDWGSCDAMCGSAGVQTRDVVCINEEVGDSCRTAKPATEKDCDGGCGTVVGLFVGSGASLCVLLIVCRIWRFRLNRRRQAQREVTHANAPPASSDDEDKKKPNRKKTKGRGQDNGPMYGLVSDGTTEIFEDVKRAAEVLQNTRGLPFVDPEPNVEECLDPDSVILDVDSNSRVKKAARHAQEKPIKAGDKLLYKKSSERTSVHATVLEVHHDDDTPYYTIRLPDGKEKQTIRANLIVGGQQRQDTKHPKESSVASELTLEGVQVDVADVALDDIQFDDMEVADEEVDMEVADEEVMNEYGVDDGALGFDKVPDLLPLMEDDNLDLESGSSFNPTVPSIPSDRGRTVQRDSTPNESCTYRARDGNLVGVLASSSARPEEETRSPQPKRRAGLFGQMMRTFGLASSPLSQNASLGNQSRTGNLSYDDVPEDMSVSSESETPDTTWDGSGTSPTFDADGTNSKSREGTNSNDMEDLVPMERGENARPSIPHESRDAQSGLAETLPADDVPEHLSCSSSSAPSRTDTDFLSDKSSSKTSGPPSINSEQAMTRVGSYRDSATPHERSFHPERHCGHRRDGGDGDSESEPDFGELDRDLQRSTALDPAASRKDGLDFGDVPDILSDVDSEDESERTNEGMPPAFGDHEVPYNLSNGTPIEEFQVGSSLLYRKPSDSKYEQVMLVKVHYDDDPPYYTIRMPNGREKQTERANLTNCSAEAMASKACCKATLYQNHLAFAEVPLALDVPEEGIFQNPDDLCSAPSDRSDSRSTFGSQEQSQGRTNLQRQARGDRFHERERRADRSSSSPRRDRGYDGNQRHRDYDRRDRGDDENQRRRNYDPRLDRDHTERRRRYDRGYEDPWDHDEYFDDGGSLGSAEDTGNTATTASV